jgi:hypothetical protein
MIKKTTQKASKKVVKKKKVTRKKAPSKKKKKVSKKKSKARAKDQEAENSEKMYATENEKLKFLHGIAQQRYYSEKLKSNQMALEMYIINHSKRVSDMKAEIVRIEEERKKSIRDYNLDMEAIKERLGFTGGFGINPETDEVIPHTSEGKDISKD